MTTAPLAIVKRLDPIFNVRVTVVDADTKSRYPLTVMFPLTVTRLLVAAVAPSIFRLVNEPLELVIVWEVEVVVVNAIDPPAEAIWLLLLIIFPFTFNAKLLTSKMPFKIFKLVNVDAIETLDN